jgi:hypothetical protein
VDLNMKSDMCEGGSGGMELDKQLIGHYRNPTLTETLRARKVDLESRLADVNAALSALEENPGVENVLNLVAKIR